MCSDFQYPLSIEISSSTPLTTTDWELLTEIQPIFCSIVWTTNEFVNVEEIPELKLAKQLIDCGYNVLLHLAGRNFKKTQIMEILFRAKSIGIRAIFALKGDVRFVKELDDTKCELPYAIDLIKFIRQHFQDHFHLGVAGYPSKHSNTPDGIEHIAYFQEKTSLADFIITQACYEFEVMKKFVENCQQNAIHLPIIYGTFVANSWNTLRTISDICQVKIPEEIKEFFKCNKDDPIILEQFSVERTKNIVEKLLHEKLCKQVHIFCLNNVKIVNHLKNAFEQGTIN